MNIELLHKVAARAKKEVGHYSDYFSYVADIDSAYDDVGLDLEALLSFDKANFAHDILGISRNLNRYTFKLENDFLPRSAV